MVEPVGDVSGWVQVGGLIGAIFGGLALIVKGSWGEGKTAISQTRAEATEVFIKEQITNRESVREQQQANRDALKALEVLLTRLVMVQEDVARMLREQREDEKFVARTTLMLRQLNEAEQAQLRPRRVE